MHAPTVLMKRGGRTNLSVGFAASSPWQGEPMGVDDARPYGSDEVRWWEEPLSRLRRQLPLERGAKGRAI